MEFTITQTPEDMDKAAARKIAEVINHEVASRGKAVIGLATGSTPIGVYKELVEMYKRKEVDFANVTTFNLDEYVVNGKEHPDFYKSDQSYHGFMDKHLFNHVNIKRENIHVPNGMATDLAKECADYEAAIKKAGGIDLQLVGIGENGHLGFCEPGSPLNARTSVVNLKKETVAVNTAKFGFAAPQALSMGLGTIYDAKEILLIANSATKAPILKNTGRHVPWLGTEADITDKMDMTVKSNPSLMLHYHKNASAIVTADAAAGVGFSTEEILAGKYTPNPARAM